MLILLSLLACKPDPGAPDYPNPSLWVDSGSQLLPGPDPYVDGEDRLSFGMFYESERSVTEPADDLFIYEGTFSAATSDERVEGAISDVWTHGGGPWWGGGAHWNEARDLSAWSTLNVDFMAPAQGGVGGFDVAMNGGSEARVAAGDAGFVADGAWHHLVIPLSDFSSGGVDLTQVTVPFILLGEGGAGGDVLFIDNLYLE